MTSEAGDLFIVKYTIKYKIDNKWNIVFIQWYFYFFIQSIILSVKIHALIAL